MTMGQTLMEKTVADLKRDEGFSACAYYDTEGNLTIGYGRLIDDRFPKAGITQQEGDLLLLNDFASIVRETEAGLPWTVGLPFPARRALLNMAFNLGLPRLKTFVKMLAALKEGDFAKAADEALDSKWARQVGAGRSGRIAALYREAALLPVTDELPIQDQTTEGADSESTKAD